MFDPYVEIVIHNHDRPLEVEMRLKDSMKRRLFESLRTGDIFTRSFVFLYKTVGEQRVLELHVFQAKNLKIAEEWAMELILKGLPR